MILRSLLSFFALLLSSASLSLADDRPNIVLIIGDDIGFADIGCFGAEIDTPNLDKLAANGMRFSQGYNMAKCNPTRSSMLTGTLLGGPECQSMGALLRDAGYTTLYSGKEHFDSWVPLERLTAMNSFDKSFCHYGGCGNFFSYEPVEIYLNDKLLTQEEIEAGTSKPYYKTNAYTDAALRFLKETEAEDKPFFLYLPYESAHYPLQALPEDYQKFEKLYDVGWDVIRENRFRKQKEMGLIAGDVVMPPLVGQGKDLYQPWEEVSEEDKKRRIEEAVGFAAMVHCLDRNIGRIVDEIESQGGARQHPDPVPFRQRWLWHSRQNQELASPNRSGILAQSSCGLGYGQWNAVPALQAGRSRGRGSHAPASALAGEDQAEPDLSQRGAPGRLHADLSRDGRSGIPGNSGRQANTESGWPEPRAAL